MTKKVFVSGCYDLLHSGHVEFFRQAAQYGDLYVGIGSDQTILHYKNHKTLYPEQERLFMVKAIRYVKDAFINGGSGIMDFVGTVDRLKPDIFVVNEDGASEEKRRFCEERGIEYVVLQRTPSEGLEARSSPHPLGLGRHLDRPTLRFVFRTGLGHHHLFGTDFRGAQALRPVHLDAQYDPQDMADETARHGPRNPCQTRLLLRERPRAQRRHHQRGTRLNRDLHARFGQALLRQTLLAFED